MFDRLESLDPSFCRANITINMLFPSAFPQRSKSDKNTKLDHGSKGYDSEEVKLPQFLFDIQRHP